MIENKTILIVDDEFQMRTLLSIYLKDEDLTYLRLRRVRKLLLRFGITQIIMI